MRRRLEKGSSPSRLPPPPPPPLSLKLAPGLSSLPLLVRLCLPGDAVGSGDKRGVTGEEEEGEAPPRKGGAPGEEEGEARLGGETIGFKKGDDEGDVEEESPLSLLPPPPPFLPPPPTPPPSRGVMGEGMAIGLARRSFKRPLSPPLPPLSSRGDKSKRIV